MTQEYDEKLKRNLSATAGDAMKEVMSSMSMSTPTPNFFDEDESVESEVLLTPSENSVDTASESHEFDETAVSNEEPALVVESSEIVEEPVQEPVSEPAVLGKIVEPPAATQTIDTTNDVSVSQQVSAEALEPASEPVAEVSAETSGVPTSYKENDSDFVKATGKFTGSQLTGKNPDGGPKVKHVHIDSEAFSKVRGFVDAVTDFDGKKPKQDDYLLGMIIGVLGLKPAEDTSESVLKIAESFSKLTPAYDRILKHMETADDRMFQMETQLSHIRRHVLDTKEEAQIANWGLSLMIAADTGKYRYGEQGPSDVQITPGPARMVHERLYYQGRAQIKRDQRSAGRDPR